MTPEQSAFARVIGRLMQIGGVLLLAFWLLLCAVAGVIAVCALLGIPAGMRYSGSPELWAGVFLGSLSAVLLGLLFSLAWRRKLERIQNWPSASAADDPRWDHSVEKSRLSTGAHVGLQFTLSIVGGLIAFVVCMMYVADVFKMKFETGLLFAIIVGAGAAVPRLILFLVPARCPDCGGPAYCRGSAPIIFVCRTCRHQHNTGISFESSSHDHS